jgi:hypothetical protein
MNTLENTNEIQIRKIIKLFKLLRRISEKMLWCHRKVDMNLDVYKKELKAEFEMAGMMIENLNGQIGMELPYIINVGDMIGINLKEGD